MNFRRRQQPAPARTETAERSLDPSLQNRVNAQHRRIQQLISEASYYEVEAANLRLDLKQADATIAYQARRIEALELTIRREVLAAETRRPPLTATPDAEPTGVLPLAEQPDPVDDYWYQQRYDAMRQSLHGEQPPRVSDDLLAQGWAGRSSAAPRAGEDR